MKSVKRLFRQIHFWLGITSGIFVFIIAITGCLYAFQEEILNLTEEYRFVESSDAPFLPPSYFEKRTKELLPQKTLHSIKYNGISKAVEAILFEPYAYYDIAYFNPYTGKLLHVKDIKNSFFGKVLEGHFYLWLPPNIGHPLVASITLLFGLSVVTGLIIWIPKNQKQLKKKISFHWNSMTRWRRKNYDLHQTVGLYAFLFALFFAVTGLVWGFDWFAKAYQNILGGKNELAYSSPSSLQNSITSTQSSLDDVYNIMNLDYPMAKSIEVHPPESKTASIAANANLEEGTYWKTEYRYFDQYSLSELEVSHIYGKIKNQTTGDQILRMNYDLHTGTILGLTGKIIAFFASLLIGTLPITGLLIWLGKKKKQSYSRASSFL